MYLIILQPCYYNWTTHEVFSFWDLLSRSILIWNKNGCIAPGKLRHMVNDNGAPLLTSICIFIHREREWCSPDWHMPDGGVSVKYGFPRYIWKSDFPHLFYVLMSESSIQRRRLLHAIFKKLWLGFLCSVVMSYDHIRNERCPCFGLFFRKHSASRVVPL